MTAPVDRPTWRVSATTLEGEIEFLEPNELAARRRAATLVHQGFVPVLQSPQEVALLASAVDRPEAAVSAKEPDERPSCIATGPALPDGWDGVAVLFSGDRSSGVVMAPNHRQYRLREVLKARSARPALRLVAVDGRRLP